jgi:hypothetical protein
MREAVTVIAGIGSVLGRGAASKQQRESGRQQELKDRGWENKNRGQRRKGRDQSRNAGGIGV